MKKFLTYAPPALALLGLTLGGCQPDIAEPKANAGGADFSRYIAVGNSLTAGYSDDGLYLEGQQNSYPALLAKQFAQVGGGAFVQPLFTEAQSNGSGYLRLAGFDATGNPSLAPVTSNLAITGLGADGKTPLYARYTGTDNQNLGVPGIRVSNITTTGYGLNNPVGFNAYFERLLPAGSPTTYLAYVQERVTTIKPTFFTNWLGNNDVLGFAGTGGTDSLTSVAEFTTKYALMTDALTAGGAKGLVANIPSITNLPLFTTVPVAAVSARINGAEIPAALIPTIKTALGLSPSDPLPAGLRFGFYITTSKGKRLATSNDLLLLTSQTVINTPSTTPGQPFPVGVGLEIPGASAATATRLAVLSNALDTKYVLDANEIGRATIRTSELNAVIQSNAQRKDLAYFNANTFFTQVARNGLVINGTNNTTSYITGGLFSLDGVHPTPRGYAVVANEMIKVINVKYGASVPSFDATAYRGVKFP